MHPALPAWLPPWMKKPPRSYVWVPGKTWMVMRWSPTRPAGQCCTNGWSTFVKAESSTPPQESDRCSFHADAPRYRGSGLSRLGDLTLQDSVSALILAATGSTPARGRATKSALWRKREIWAGPVRRRIGSARWFSLGACRGALRPRGYRRSAGVPMAEGHRTDAAVADGRTGRKTSGFFPHLEPSSPTTIAPAQGART